MARMRGIKPEMLTDCKTGTLSSDCYKFFTGLWIISDDYGVSRFNIHEYKAKIFCYRTETPEELINPLIFDELLAKELIEFFDYFDGTKKEKYLFIKNFKKHQYMNRMFAPLLPGWVKGDDPKSYFERTQSVITHCVVTDTSCTKRKRNRKEKNINNIYQDIITSGAEPKNEIFDNQEIDEVLITFVLNDKSEYPITQTKVEEWKSLFPAVDIMEQLRKAKSWCIDNPTRRKTKRGILSFINRWLCKEQDSGAKVINFNGGRVYANREKRIESLAEKVARQQREDHERDRLQPRQCI
jgi:hypothetical protein